MLDAIAALVGFLDVAVNETIRRESLATALALLTISATAAHLALNFVIRLGVNFSATLELTAANGPHASLHIRVKRLRSRPVRRVNLLLARSDHAADLLIHRGLSLLAVFHVMLLWRVT